MKKTLIVSVFAVSAFITTGVFAYQGNPGVQNPNPIDPVKHEAVQKAIADKDFATWSKLMTGGVASKITTQTQFEKFVQMHQAMEKWDSETAKKLATELNLWVRKMDWTGMKNGMKNWKWNWLRNGTGNGKNRSNNK